MQLWEMEMQDPGAEFGGGEGWKEGRGVAACCKTPHFSTVITPQNNRSGFQISQWTQPMEWNDGEQNSYNIWTTLNVTSKFFAILRASWQVSFLFDPILYCSEQSDSDCFETESITLHTAALQCCNGNIWFDLKIFPSHALTVSYSIDVSMYLWVAKLFFQHSENLTGDGAGGCGKNFAWK